MCWLARVISNGGATISPDGGNPSAASSSQEPVQPACPGFCRAEANPTRDGLNRLSGRTPAGRGHTQSIIMSPGQPNQGPRTQVRPAAPEPARRHSTMDSTDSSNNQPHTTERSNTQQQRSHTPLRQPLDEGRRVMPTYLIARHPHWLHSPADTGKAFRTSAMRGDDVVAVSPDRQRAGPIDISYQRRSRQPPICGAPSRPPTTSHPNQHAAAAPRNRQPSPPAACCGPPVVRNCFTEISRARPATPDARAR